MLSGEPGHERLEVSSSCLLQVVLLCFCTCLFIQAAVDYQRTRSLFWSLNTCLCLSLSCLHTTGVLCYLQRTGSGVRPSGRGHCCAVRSFFLLKTCFRSVSATSYRINCVPTHTHTHTHTLSQTLLKWQNTIHSSGREVNTLSTVIWAAMKIIQSLIFGGTTDSCRHVQDKTKQNWPSIFRAAENNYCSIIFNHYWKSDPVDML